MRRSLVVILGLSLLTLALYAPVRCYQFVNFDDDLYVTGNDYVLNGFSAGSVRWAFKNTHANFWHPLTTLSLMLDAELYGKWPGGFHITNVLLHIANTLLLFVALRGMTGGLWQSAFVAALFAWHPLHVESVAWVSERKDLLSGFFWMLTLLAYARYASTPNLCRYLLVFACFACGLMAKPMVVTLPFVLLLLDFWPLKRFRFQERVPLDSAAAVPLSRLILEKIPLLVLSAAFSVIAFRAQGTAVALFNEVPVWVRLVNVPLAYLGYISRMLWPQDLAVYYPYPDAVALPKMAAAVFFLGAVTWAAVQAGKRYPSLPVGWFWFLGTLVPVIGVIQIGEFFMADRFTYLPLIGLFLMLAWGVSEILAALKLPNTLTLAVATVALLGCMTTSVAQLRYWRNSVSLFEHALAVTSDNQLAHYNLAIALNERGRRNEAIEHYRAAIEIDPDFAKAYNNLGIALFQSGNAKEAIEHFRTALRLKPNMAGAHNNLANALTEQGKIDEAIQHYEAALRIDPNHPHARENLRLALARKRTLR